MAEDELVRARRRCRRPVESIAARVVAARVEVAGANGARRRSTASPCGEELFRAREDQPPDASRRGDFSAFCLSWSMHYLVDRGADFLAPSDYQKCSSAGENGLPGMLITNVPVQSGLTL